MGRVSLGLVHPQRIDAGDERELRQLYDVFDAAWAVDHPDLPYDPFEEMLVDATTARRSYRDEWWLLRDASRQAIGGYRLSLPQLDNTDNAPLDLVVHPSRRRTGLGRLLFAHASDRVQAVGRRRIVMEVGEPLAPTQPAPGPAFATAVGAARALDEVRRALDLQDLDAARLDALKVDALARADGYRLVQWVDTAPDDVVDELAVLMGRMSTDAPLEDLAWEAEHWDVERVREQERVTAAKGRRRLVTAALHEASGSLVAYTDVAVSTHQPEAAYQWDTLVLAAHRGHRLGMLVKIANLELLRREAPDARTLSTWNAASNTHMVAINEALGFRPVERWCEWQLDLLGASPLR